MGMQNLVLLGTAQVTYVQYGIVKVLYEPTDSLVSMRREPPCGVIPLMIPGALFCRTVRCTVSLVTRIRIYRIVHQIPDDSMMPCPIRARLINVRRAPEVTNVASICNATS